MLPTTTHPSISPPYTHKAKQQPKPTNTVIYTTMLALKKKREAEKKAAEEAAGGGAAAPAAATVSLLGVGGKKQTGRNGDSANSNGKKRTPGEIRIQKGACVRALLCRLLLKIYYYLLAHSDFQSQLSAAIHVN